MRIVVIGAGLLGITTAYFLSRYGHQVVVIDRREGPALETSHANGSMLTPSQAGPWNVPGITSKLIKWMGREGSPFLFSPGVLPAISGWGIAFLYNSSIACYRINLQKNAQLAEYSMDVLRQLRADLQLRYDQSTVGTMKLYRSREDFAEALKIHGLYKTDEIPVEILDQSGVIRLEPALSAARKEIAGGIFYPADESGDAYQFCQHIADCAAAVGTEFRYGQTVERFIRSDSHIISIETAAGLIEGDIYVLAAGSYSPGLVRSLGISIPVQPVKGYSLTLAARNPEMMPGLPVVDESRHIAITPLGKRIRIAGSAELRGHDVSIDHVRLNKIFRYFDELYPGLCSEGDLADAQRWAGLRPYSSDGVPVIGECRIDNLFLNTGHGHLGWTMGAGSGKLLADLISHGKAELDLQPYRLSRFN